MIVLRKSRLAPVTMMGQTLPIAGQQLERDVSRKSRSWIEPRAITLGPPSEACECSRDWRIVLADREAVVMGPIRCRSWPACGRAALLPQIL